RHGRHASDFGFPCGWPDRLSLLFGRSCRRLWLHRRDDVVWSGSDNHSTDGARSEYFGRFHWRISILAGWTFYLEIVLAVRAAFDSSCLSWRLSPTVRVGFKTLDRVGPVIFGRSFDLPA